MTNAPHLARIDAVLTDMGIRTPTNAASAQRREGRPKPYTPSRAEQAAAKAKRQPPAAPADDEATYRAAYGTDSKPVDLAPAEAEAYEKVFGSSGGADKGSTDEQATYAKVFGA